MAKYSFWVVFHPDTVGDNKKKVVTAYVPSMKGVVAGNDTLSKTRSYIKECIVGVIKSMLLGNEAVTSDSSTKKPRVQRVILALEYITVEVRKPTKKKKLPSHRSKDSSDWLMEDI